VRALLRPDAMRNCPKQVEGEPHLSEDPGKLENKLLGQGKLTDVAGRINSSNVQRAHASPHSRVLHAASSSLSSVDGRFWYT
jgi:hypothetical protein